MTETSALTQAAEEYRAARDRGEVQALNEAGGSERASRFYSLADLDGKPVPERQWHVHGLIPMKQVTLLSGDGGTGKSLLALQLAIASATDKLWLGRTVRTGSTIFISAEDDDDELHARAAEVCTCGIL